MVNFDDSDNPVVQLVNKIISDAVDMQASDIHFEPYESIYRVRYRIDGVLLEVANPNISLKDKISSRLKIISNLDIAEKRIPQDGKLRINLPNSKVIDCRINSLPTAFGEKIVIRILDQHCSIMQLDSIGIASNQYQILLNNISRQYGIILVTGATGSGKTNTLYSLLNYLNNGKLNISTIEDPIEVNLFGINQVAVNEKIGLDFNIALRAFLRQDPDIIMVGEIRDIETAEIAVKAAQTGHLILSTLHTNTAASAIARLVTMGVPAYNIIDSVICIVAQKLVRKLCDFCKIPHNINIETLLSFGYTNSDIVGDWVPYRAIGCSKCFNTGYKGRTGIFEILQMTDEIRQLIMSNAPVAEINTYMQASCMITLKIAALEKVKQGITSINEVMVTIN